MEIHKGTKAHIQALFCYPVKSCAGFALDQVNLTGQGVCGDRQWMIVDENMRMYTQRQNPKLALIKAEYLDENLKPQAYHPAYLRLSHIHSPQDAILVKPTQNGNIDETGGQSSKKTLVSIWKDEIRAILHKESITEWLCHMLKVSHKLYLVQASMCDKRQRHDPQRFQNPAYHFSDAAPLLIANEASLAALNQKLGENNEKYIDISHFRANIVLSGIHPFSEHRYNYIIGSLGTRIRLVDHCQRCIVITIDPKTGFRRDNGSPMRTLAKLNSMPCNPKAPAFGVNAELECHSIADGQKTSLERHTQLVVADNALQMRVNQTIELI